MTRGGDGRSRRRGLFGRRDRGTDDADEVVDVDDRLSGFVDEDADPGEYLEWAEHLHEEQLEEQREDADLETAADAHSDGHGSDEHEPDAFDEAKEYPWRG